MFNLLSTADLPSFTTLFTAINADMGNGQIWVMVVAACLMLAIHAVDDVMTRRRIFGASFLSYFIAILLVIAIHLTEIVMWAYICVALKVFPTKRLG
ncbi:hypothetical protein [Polynucleobacter necessarius]|uniref:hypothetical protein n=1 Tax=Polynucleobacter necessarius TaxID=576610 RepID=UPI000E095F28|nr:hypothetical protein [Polynucleobacter necessarius]